jgi:hypothetical protein
MNFLATNTWSDNRIKVVKPKKKLLIQKESERNGKGEGG